MSKELEKELKETLKEIGKITPVWAEDVQSFIFEHPAYPVRYAGDTPEEVIQNYPLYLKDFLEERMKGNLAPLIESMTSGRGGYREGSGRPKGSGLKEPTKMVRLPVMVADWIKADPDHLETVKRLIG